MMFNRIARIAGIAEKAAKEVAYHLRRSSDLVVRLGDGTERSHSMMQAAIDNLWRFTGEMFHSDEIDAAAVAAESAADHPGAVKSPMVGTVYLSAEPGAAPFIAEGKQVQAGDTLLIVEAMKVMNPITAPRAGRVAQLLVENAQPIEFDQPLVIIE